MYFELGGRKVSIIETPGHSAGSVSFLDEKNGWLFSGDTDCRDGVLLNLDGSTSVEVFYQTIRKLQGLVEKGDVKTLYPSHQATPLDAGILKDYAKACKDILEGNISSEELRNGVHQYKEMAVLFVKEQIRQ